MTNIDLSKANLYKAVDATVEALYVDKADAYNAGVGDALESVLRYFGLFNEWSDK